MKASLTFVDIVLDYWRSGQGLGNITPPGSSWPEGEGFPQFLTGLCQGEEVVEVGCGPGRLAGAFPPTTYVGVDICPEAVEKAKVIYPSHDFRTIESGDPLPSGTCALFHTVLLHVPDESLSEMLRRLDGFSRIIVGEILGRHWRRSGNPPVFNREMEDYERAFDKVGFHLFEEYRIPYPRYRDTWLTVMDFHRVQIETGV